MRAGGKPDMQRACLGSDSLPTDVNDKPLDFGTLGNVKPTGGHCCRAFTLFWTFDDLAVAYNAAKGGLETFVRPATGEEVELPDDILTLGPMVRLVGVCDRNPLAGDAFQEPRKVWRCAHHRDDFTCGIYERRPKMCRRYPSVHHGDRCRFVHCQSVDCPAYWTREERDENLLVHPRGPAYAKGQQQ